MACLWSNGIVQLILIAGGRIADDAHGGLNGAVANSWFGFEYAGALLARRFI